MAYLRGVANPHDPKETLVFTHWISVIQLLKAGMPWEAIHTLTETEVTFVFGVLMALDQKQAEDQQRQMAAAH